MFIRMPDERLPKNVFYEELQEIKCPQGGQKKRDKDTLKSSIMDFDIPMGSWGQTANQRGLMNKGAALYERICEAERKRRERKAKTTGPLADSMTLTGSTCNRQFIARIGQVSHQRTYLHTRTLFKK